MAIRVQRRSRSGSLLTSTCLPVFQSSRPIRWWIIVCAVWLAAGQGSNAQTQSHGPLDAYVLPASFNQSTESNYGDERAFSRVVNDSGSPFQVGFENGFYIRSSEPDPHYEMRVKARLQLRHTGFIPTEEQFVSRGGTVRELQAINRFEMERVRLQFHGNVFTPDLRYVFIIDGDNDGRTQLDFLIYFFEYGWAENHHVAVGREKNAASFEWIQSSRVMSFNDRSMATAFFRPVFSDGIWFRGNSEDRQWFYRFMLTNGFNTTRLATNEVDDRITSSLAVWWEPNGPFGVGYADIQHHNTPAWRFGVSGIYAPHRGITPGATSNELNVFRLVDGTRLLETGAISPGASVVRFDAGLTSFLAAMKYRGWSFMTEYYLRWLADLRADAPIDNPNIFQHGFVVAGGMFLVPEEWEFVARHSQANGDYGSAHEYAAGLNWYIRGHDLKIQFDVTRLVQSPANDAGPDFVAGDDGVLIRTQVQLAF